MRQRQGLNIRCCQVSPVESSSWSSIWAGWQGDSLLPSLAILIPALAYVFDNYLDKDIKCMECVYLSFFPSCWACKPPSCVWRIAYRTSPAGSRAHIRHPILKEPDACVPGLPCCWGVARRARTSRSASHPPALNQRMGAQSSDWGQPLLVSGDGLHC